MDLVNDMCFWESKFLLRVGNWVVGVCVVFSLDFDLEVFSYNLVYGSFVLLVF